MNKQRRNKLQQLIDDLDIIITEEQDAFDNMPESFQMSEKGDRIEEGLDSLNEAKDLLEETCSNL